MTGRKGIKMFYAIAILVALIDQISKYLIRSYLHIGETASLWGIELTHYENSGMARSLFQGYARLFGIAAVIFVAAVLYYRRTGQLKGLILNCSLGFLVGGAVGNAIDRLLFGQVTDFLVSRSGKGILNFADHAIEAGVLLLILHGVIQFTRKHFIKRKFS
ncbi:signal peptidase II [Paenibacillus solisilvae]|uniref:Lipoprotein signal peptidase n=1 Tax=Paenibacillus solisilvae TaxID=2486751 RepID=A0ABW0W2M8_9BACL